MSPGKRRTAFILIAGLIASFCALIIGTTSSFSRAALTKSLQETFPATVTFQKFHRTFFPHPGFIAEGAVFRQLGRSPEIPPIVTIARLQLRARYFDQLFRPGYVASILADGFQVYIPPEGTPLQETGWKETPSKLRVGEILFPDAVLEIAREGTRKPLLFPIHSLKLSGADRNRPVGYELAMGNALPPGEIRARGQFGPWNTGNPGETPLSGTYIFANADLGVFDGLAGTLSAKGEFHGPLGQIESTGDVNIPDFALTRTKHPIDITSSYRALIDGTNGDTTLQRVDSYFLKTRILARGKVAGISGQKGKTASLDLFGSRARLQDMMRIVIREPEPPFNGFVNFRAHAVIPPVDAPFLQKVRVGADFGIVGGEFTDPDNRKTVNDFSERARGQKPDDDSEKSDRVVSNLAGHVELKDASANFSHFSFAIPGASAKMQGTYGLIDRKINLHGTLKSEAELSELKTGVMSVLLKPFDRFFKKKHAGAVIPVHLVGTYDDPQPGVDILPKGAQEPAQP